MICKNCGAQNQDFARFCKSCGKAMDAQPEQKPASEYRQYKEISSPLLNEQQTIKPDIFTSPNNYGVPSREDVYAPPKGYDAPSREDVYAPPKGYGVSSHEDVYAPPKGYGVSSHEDVYAPPKGYGVPSRESAYTPPMGYSAPPPNLYAPPYSAPPVVNNYMYSPGSGGRYRSIEEVPVTPAFWFAVILIVVSFVSLFTPWMTVKAKYRGETIATKNLKYFDLYDDDDDDEYDISDTYFKDEDKTDEICSNVMKWGGLIGFVSLLLALVFAAALRERFIIAVADSFVCFLAVAIAGLVDCPNLKKYLRKIVGSSVDFSVFNNVGIWLPLGCTFLAQILAAADKSQRRNILAMSR